MSRSGRIAIVLLLLLAGLVLGAELVVRSVALGRIRTAVERDLAATLGLEISVGEMRLELLPRPHLDATRVRMVRADEKVRAEVGRIELAIALRPLLRRALVVNRIDVEDVDLRVVSVESDAAPVADALVDSLDALASDRDATPSSGDEWFDFYVRRLVGRDLSIHLVAADGGPLRSLHAERFDLGSLERDGPILVQTRGEMDGAAFDLRMRGGPIREFLRPSEPYPVELDGRVFDAEVTARGTLRIPLQLSGVELAVSARVPDVAVTGWPLPDLGPVLLEGELSDLDGTLGFERVTIATLGKDPLDAAVEGRVDDLARFGEVELEARARAGRIGFLETWFDVPIPEDVEAEATATLDDAKGPLGGEGRLHLETLGSGVSLDLRGRYGDLARVAGIDLELDARAADLATLARLFPTLPELPPIGPVRARGRLRDRNGRLGLDEIRVEVSQPDGPAPWAEVRGSVDDVANRTGIALDGRFAVRSAERFGEAIGRTLPPLGAFEGVAHLADRDGTLGLEKIRLATTGDGPIRVEVEATLDDILAHDEITADVEIEARSLATVGEVVGHDWPRIGPVAFAARMSGSDELLLADDARIRVGGTRIAGDLAARFSEGARPFLRARLQSPRARLEDFLEEPDARARRRRSLLAEDLPFDLLRSIDLDLGVEIGLWEGPVGKVRRLRGALWLEDGRLILSDVQGRYRRGRFVGWARIDGGLDLPEVSLRLDATGVDLAKLLAQLDGEAEATGLADLHFDLTSAGHTAQQLLLGLAGRARAVMRDGTAVSQYSRRFVVNLATSAFPFLQIRSAPRIGCAVADFVIEDGIAEVQEFFLEEGGIVIVGQGTVDLPAGEYHLHFTPRDRNQGLLSVAPQVEVTGPLEAPEFTAVKRTVFSSLGAGILSSAKRAGLRLANPFRSVEDAEEAAAAACADVGRADDEEPTASAAGTDDAPDGAQGKSETAR